MQDQETTRLEGKEDWSTPRPDQIPPATYTPVGIAFGVVFLVWGLLTSPIVSAVGLVIFVASLAGWIGGILHERR